MPWVTAAPDEFISALERSGESEVRAALDRGDEWITHDGRSKIAEGWLTSKTKARADAVVAKRDARAEEMLSIAKSQASAAALAASAALEQASAARRQARWAMWAAIIATVAVAITTKDQIIELVISWIP